MCKWFVLCSCFYTENDAFYTYIFLTRHWSWLCMYGVWLLCVYIGMHMKYGILFDWYKPCYILLYGKRAHFIQCCMGIVRLKHHSDWLIHHLSSCRHFIKITWWPETVVGTVPLCLSDTSIVCGSSTQTAFRRNFINNSVVFSRRPAVFESYYWYHLHVVQYVTSLWRLVFYRGGGGGGARSFQY